jgi:hypothetical protein
MVLIETALALGQYVLINAQIVGLIEARIYPSRDRSPCFDPLSPWT